MGDYQWGANVREAAEGCRAGQKALEKNALSRIWLVFPGAGTGAVGAAATATGTRRHGRRGRRGSFGRDGKNGQFRFQLFALAFGASGFLLAVDESLKLMMTFLANVLEDGHGDGSG